jgi:hypothetical protein
MQIEKFTGLNEADQLTLAVNKADDWLAAHLPAALRCPVKAQPGFYTWWFRQWELRDTLFISLVYRHAPELLQLQPGLHGTKLVPLGVAGPLSLQRLYERLPGGLTCQGYRNWFAQTVLAEAAEDRPLYHVKLPDHLTPKKQA